MSKKEVVEAGGEVPPKKKLCVPFFGFGAIPDLVLGGTIC